VKEQVEFMAWLDRLPENLQDSATAEALRAICELDLSELQAIVPPRGFGRDPPRGFGRDPPRGFGRDPPRGFGRDPPRGFGRDPPRGFGRD
jgi:hypothetical protein